MEMIPVLLNLGEKRLVPALQEAREKLSGMEGEAVLDFSSVQRVDPSVLRAMEEFVGAADEKGVKVILSGVNVGVYKVLKLAKLAPRFSVTR
ncbi:MAG TPA: STAS domain-containing protein [Candidatus Acidoferrum sp.]|nr:STAS domain-containing protein [Candidatus Acidoferrum sp.]